MRNCVGEFWTSFKISIRMNMVILIEACLQTCSVCEWWPVNSPHKGSSRFPHKGPLVYSFEIFFVIGLNTTWSKHSRSLSFDTPWYSCDIIVMPTSRITIYFMMTSSNGKIFRVTGHLCGEFTGLRWIPRTKASDAELWYYLWSTSE